MKIFKIFILCLVCFCFFTSSTLANEEPTDKEILEYNFHMERGFWYSLQKEYTLSLKEFYLADNILIMPITKYWLGKTFLFLKQEIRAELLFDFAIKLYKSDEFMIDIYYAEANAEKSFCLVKKKKYQKALEYLETALVFCEGRKKPLYRLIELSIKSKINKVKED